MNTEKFKKEDFTEDELTLLKLAFKLAEDVVESGLDGVCYPYLSNTLYHLREKLGIDELVY